MKPPETPAPEDATPVRDLTDDEAARLELIRAAAGARADRELAVVELAAAQRELDRLRARVERLERRNDELLAAEVERDELRGQCDRLTIEVLQLKRALAARGR